MGWKNKQLERESPAHGQPAVHPEGVLGIDVSSHQGKVNWAAGSTRAGASPTSRPPRARRYRNPYFSSQYNGSAKAGMIRGAYHFANPAGKSGVDPGPLLRQARRRLDGRRQDAARRARHRVQPVRLDLLRREQEEDGGLDQGFTQEYKRLTTRDAVIYTTADWWNRCTGNTTKFSTTNPLWAARYGTKTAGKLPRALDGRHLLAVHLVPSTRTSSAPPRQLRLPRTVVSHVRIRRAALSSACPPPGLNRPMDGLADRPPGSATSALTNDARTPEQVAC